MSTLRPCPFCGCTEQSCEGSVGGSRVVCSNCFTAGPLGRTMLEAFDVWNRRARPELRPVRATCDDDGDGHRDVGSRYVKPYEYGADFYYRDDVDALFGELKT